jgi:hypothetical protein
MRKTVQELIKETQDLKMRDLEAVIGKPVSCNPSPTSRGKLVSIDRDYCTIEIVENRGYNDKLVGTTFEWPLGYVHNMYFF